MAEFKLSHAANCDRNDVIVRSNNAVIAETRELRNVTRQLFEAVIENTGLLRLLRASVMENTATLKTIAERIGTAADGLADRMDVATPAIDRLAMKIDPDLFDGKS